MNNIPLIYNICWIISRKPDSKPGVKAILTPLFGQPPNNILPLNRGKFYLSVTLRNKLLHDLLFILFLSVVFDVIVLSSKREKM